ncbi:tetratricopeptide repeat-containing sensor histidine kinase [Sphingobacterium thalpophilum]|uniref:tetratricopeptide repeat-containing sensor histidine kinase n=1 Tax=Sphingobacterium thalpophilum TaxID=259 RepID=UPI0024A70262|nr:tetratricopeptide repeat-containing sensor histidine kinase [Sphingobacterium thalpophilum]
MESNKDNLLKNSQREGDFYYNRAKAFLAIKQSDSSYFYFNKARQIYQEINDSLSAAKSIINMAITQGEEGDYFGSQETSLQALDYLDKKEIKHHFYLSINYNNLGAVTDYLKDYDQAISFYKQAINFSTDSANRRIYENNLALSYQYAKRYDDALAIFEHIIKQVQPKDPEYPRILTNLAKTRWLKNHEYPANIDFLKAMNIRVSKGDLWGINSSYTHLAEYYEVVNKDSALFYAIKRYSAAKNINSPGDQINALNKLIEISEPHKIRSYFIKFKQLSDSIQQARSAAKNQFALIRYEVEKNKADNLRLEKENAEKQSRLVRQRAITGASISLLLLAVGGGSLWYKRRKQRLELEAQNRIKETQLNLSKKIHDVVANGIYRVMSEIENNDNVDRDGVLDKLEDMYHQSRDISHDVEQQTITEIPYSEQLASLLKSFAADQRLVLIAGNDPEQWEDVGKRVKDEVKHVLQELMVNMKKHSQAERVIVRFEKSDQRLMVFYKDNGVGMPAENSGGKGLANTVSRIESLGGKIIFASEPGEGLSITTSIPLA